MSPQRLPVGVKVKIILVKRKNESERRLDLKLKPRCPNMVPRSPLRNRRSKGYQMDAKLILSLLMKTEKKLKSKKGLKVNINKISFLNN